MNKGKFTYELWDKISPINGIEAEKVLEIHGITKDVGAIGLIKNYRGAVTVFQYDKGVPYTDEEALEVVREMCEDINNPKDVIEE